MKRILILTIIALMATVSMGQGKKSDTEFYFSMKWKYIDDSTLVKIPKERLFVSFTDSMVVYNDTAYRICVIFYDNSILYSTIAENQMRRRVGVIFTRPKVYGRRYYISIDPDSIPSTKPLTAKDICYEAKRINVKHFKRERYENK